MYMYSQNTLPLTGITVVTETDIICGRSGLALKHPGNASYRKIVGLNKELYATCLKTEKLRISKSVVAAIREINGRFLEREDGKTSSSLDERDANGNPVTWCDIGDKRAVEKTSQALREGQPKLLKKLAEKQNGGPEQESNRGDGSPLPPTIVPFSNVQSSQQGMPNEFNQGGMQMADQQNPAQHTFPGPQRPDFAGGRHTSFSLGSMVQGETFSSFPRNSIVDGNNNSRFDSWHDSWGDQDLAPLSGVGGHDPTPLPYNMGGEANPAFSSDDQQQLMASLDVEGVNKRSSVSFKLETGRPSIMSAMSLSSAFSSSDARSLDTAMDAAQRDAEFDLLGEFGLNMEGEELPIVTFDIPEKIRNRCSTNSSSQSILRKNRKWTPHSSFPPAPLNHNVDPGFIFTATMDTRPGGINSGNDVSGLLGDRRESAVAFENDVNRRRSTRMSRLSMISQMSDVTAMLKRDRGSMTSIQSVDYRQLMEDISDQIDDDSVVEVSCTA